MSETSVRKWAIGDLCTYHNREGTGFGILYRVQEIVKAARFNTTLFNLQPVHGPFLEIKNRKRLKSVSPCDCTYMSLVDLATTYAKLGAFISDEARKRGTDVAAPDA